MNTSFTEHWRVFGELASALDMDGAVKATKYLSPKLVIKATRKRLKGKIDNRKGSVAQIVFTVGAPNFAEREFIKAAKKAKEAFPVKHVQMRFQKGY